jgi:hypothetical protein
VARELLAGSGAWVGGEAGRMNQGAKMAAISTDDTDVRWLLDLLRLLPAMTADVPRDVVHEREIHPALDVGEVEKEAAEWWDRFGELHPDRIDRGRYPRVHLLPYALRIVEGKADDEDVRSLAQYCLLLFDVADLPECCEHLDVVVQSHIPQRGRAGRRWAESVTEVAWRLYVPRQAHGRLREGLAAWPERMD